MASGDPEAIREELQSDLEAAHEKAKEQTAWKEDLAVALRYSGVVVGSVPDIIADGNSLQGLTFGSLDGLKSQPLLAGGTSAASELLRNSGITLAKAYTQGVAMMVLQSSHQTLEAFLLPGGKPNSLAIEAWANRSVHSFYEQGLSDFDNDTRAAVEWGENKVTRHDIAVAVLNMYGDQKAVRRLASEPDDVRKQVRDARSGIQSSENALTDLRGLAKTESDTATQLSHRVADLASEGSKQPPRKVFAAVQSNAPVPAKGPCDFLTKSHPVAGSRKKESGNKTNSDEEVAGCAKSINDFGHNSKEQMGKVADALRAVGAPDLADGVNKAGQLLDTMSSFGAAVVLGGGLGIGVAALAVVGLVASWVSEAGGSSSGVMQAIQQLEIEIRAFHVEEMNALRTISAQVAELDRAMRKQMSTVLDAVVENGAGIDELLRDHLSQCQKLEDGFQARHPKHDLLSLGTDVLSAWFKNSGFGHEYVDCMDSLSMIVSLGDDSRVSHALRYVARSRSSLKGDSGEMSFPLAEEFAKRIYEPAVAYGARYREDLRGVDWLARLVIPQVRTREMMDLEDSPEYATWRRQPPSWAVTLVEVRHSFDPIGGGALMVDPRRVIDVSTRARHIAPIDLVSHRDATQVSVLTASQLADMNEDWFKDQVRGRQLLLGADAVLSITIAQEQLIAGVDAVVFAAKVIKDKVLPSYAIERQGGSEKPLTALLTNVDQGRLTQCDSGNEVADTLCLMQLNPWFADNVMQVLATQAADERGFDQRWYEVARQGPDERILQMWLGSDARLSDGRSRIAAGTPTEGAVLWGLELPQIDVRSESGQDNGSVPAAPGSCWGEPSSGKWPELSRYLADPRWARCYALPARIDGTGPLRARDGFERLVSERDALEDALWAMSMPSSESDRLLKRVAAFARALNDAGSAKDAGM
jgi:hypothetical protein